MGFFVILLYLSGYLALILAAICLASGLYYLANLAEEHSVATKAFLKYSAIVKKKRPFNSFSSLFFFFNSDLFLSFESRVDCNNIPCSFVAD